LDQTFGHYQAVAGKLGINLAKHRDEKKLIFFNGLKRILLSSLGEESILRPENGLEELLSEILDLLEPDTFLILDNISVLTSLGFSDRAVYLFLMKLSRRIEETDGRILTTFSQDEPDTLSNNISRNSDIHFTTQDLKTGKSKDVSGHLSIHRRTDCGGFSTQDYQFLIEEKNIKVFPPGTSGAVL
jgi:hypothetical protein